MSITSVGEHTYTADGHTTFYLAAGPEDGPLIVFVHGWPEQAISWRHQLPVLAGLGFRAVAPDMRGYGRSTVYDRNEDYAQALVVADMLCLLDGLGAERAVWVGHDWGSPTVWGLASHHPERCVAVANLCVPYLGLDNLLAGALKQVDRAVYPEDEFPAGQWEYQLFYQEHFQAAVADLDANPYNTIKALFRKGDPAGQGRPSRTAYVRKNGGWFGPGAAAPDIPRDGDVVSADEVQAYAEALARNGFFGPCSYYMNHQANGVHASQARNEGYLDLPVLFLHGRYDYTCETVTSTLAEPMRVYCRDLDERVIESGHWMAQERPAEVNAALLHWLATKVGSHWPG